MPQNLFDTAALPKDAEQIALLLQQGGVRLEWLVSFGHPTPEGSWYEQPETEWVALLKGQALLRYADGRALEMRAGDTLLIPAHLRHRVERVSEDAVWIALFLPE